MGGFRVCIYMGFSPHCIFVTSKIIYCINSHHRSVYSFGLTDCQRACSPFFSRDRRLSSAQSATDPDRYRRLMERIRFGPDALSLCAMLHGRTGEHRNLRERPVRVGLRLWYCTYVGGWSRRFTGPYHNGLMD